MTYLNAAHPSSDTAKGHFRGHIVDENNPVGFAKVLLCNASKSINIDDGGERLLEERQTFLDPPRTSKRFDFVIDWSSLTVSQSCNAMTRSLMLSILICRSTPIVAANDSLKVSVQKRWMKLVFPTPLSPGEKIRSNLRLLNTLN